LLSSEEIQNFIGRGFVKIDVAFDRETADECRAILWKATQYSPDDVSTWLQPVVRIGELALEPFRRAANSPVLLEAFDQLVGPGNWLPRQTLGSFPIRFPHAEQPNDTGWHVDASFPGEDAANFFDWRINVHSKGRALLMLFLFSDVGDDDAPTRIRVGSHLEVARLLAPAGDAGLSFMELAQRLESTGGFEEAAATGPAGSVYFCHPFLVHAAQAHRGKNPKFMAQPPLLTACDLRAGNFPVQQAIHLALSQKN
jgi:hypothetical protein